jgi:hypothetical protein
MTRGTRLFPYATIGDAAVIWDAWWLEIAGERVPLPKYAPGWDYASHLVVGLTATIDEETALLSTGLDHLEELAIVLVADCKASQRRFITTEVLMTGINSVELRREIPPGEVADSLSLSAALVLARDLEPVPDRAHRAGSRLGSSSSYTLILEGEASRFPTETVSFAAAGYEAAPWTIASSAESLEDSLMGSVRLLINEDHPWGQRLLEDADTPELSKQLQADVFRGLVTLCAELSDEVVVDLEEDSLGGVADYMCQLYLRRGLSEAMKVLHEEPRRFDRLVYAAVTP